jgi:hypothetical protein
MIKITARKLANRPAHNVMSDAVSVTAPKHGSLLVTEDRIECMFRIDVFGKICADKKLMRRFLLRMYSVHSALRSDASRVWQ